MCERLCWQPAGEGEACWCMAISRNGGTGPASALTLTRCSCTLRAYLHIKSILHYWRESSVSMAWGCPSTSTVLRGRAQTLLHHVQSGEVGAAYSQWHQHSCSSVVCGRPAWQLSLLSTEECWHSMAGQIDVWQARACTQLRERQSHHGRREAGAAFHPARSKLTCPGSTPTSQTGSAKASGEQAGLGAAAWQG